MIDWLLETDLWPARRSCGTWTDTEVLWSVMSGIAIFAAYAGISAVLLHLVANLWGAAKVLEKLVLTLFAAFILLCGIGHIINDVMPFFFPAYRLTVVWNVLTAIASLATLALLRPIIAALIR